MARFTDLIIFLLVSFGLTTLITRSSLVAWAVRTVGLARWPLVVQGLRCTQCVGFWVGFGLTNWGLSIAGQTALVWWTLSSVTAVGSAVVHGLISSGVAWFLTTLANPYREVDHD